MNSKYFSRAINDFFESNVAPKYTTGNLLNIYRYGSSVYGTIDQHSDLDFIVICDTDENKSEFTHNNNNITIYNKRAFEALLISHDISALECIFLPSHNCSIKHKFPFTLSLPMLRHSISSKASHSFVKAKKKLTVRKNYNERVGKKSLFHSLRIILFGIQIAKYGRIVDYFEATDYWADILSISDWKALRKKYKPEFNRLMTEFRKLAPKK